MNVRRKTGDWRAFGILLGIVALLTGSEMPLWSQPSSPPVTAESNPESVPSSDQQPAAGESPPQASAKSLPAVEAPGQSASSASSNPDDVIYLQTPDGPKPVLKNVALEQFLEWLRDRKNAPEDPAPEFSVSSIALEGTVEDDERALLTARIGVQVSRDEKWIRVPVKINEGILLDASHGAVGEGLSGGFDRDAGYRWWLRGKGLHELTLSLSVPLRKQLPTRRLQLTLPEAAVSSLKLRVPMSRVSVKPPEKSSLKTRSVPGKIESEIELFGVGTALDLSWQPVPEPKEVKTELQSTTLISAELTPDDIKLEASQTVRALQGSFEKVIVRLPSGFELLDIEGKEVREWKVDPADPRRVTVDLTEATTGPVELKSTLYGEYPADSRNIVIEGFEVDLARRQTGYIAITTLEGFRVLKRDGDHFVHRVNVSDLRSLSELRTFVGNGEVASAYEFLKQPYRLVLGLEEIEPFFTAEPRLFLKVTPDRAELQAQVRFQVFRGAVREVDLPWPNWKTEGWLIESIESDLPLEQQPMDANDAGDNLRVRLVEPRLTDFEFRLTARRPADTNAAGFDLTLPGVAASSRLPTLLVVANADNVENELKPLGKTSVRPLAETLLNLVELPAELEDLRRTAYRVDSDQRSFRASVSVHTQMIETQTVISVAMEEERLRVTQRIHYTVEYERLSQLRLLVPATLQNQVLFAAEDGRPLIAAWSAVEGPEFQQARLALPEPMIGPVEIVARYFVSLPEKVSSTSPVKMTLPFIRPVEVEQFSSGRFEIASADDQEMAVTVADPAWKPQLSADNSTQWVAGSGRNDVVLALTASSEQPASRYFVTKAAIRVAIDEEGSRQFRCQYLINGEVSSLSLRFPTTTVGQSIAAWWDTDRIAAASVSRASSASDEYRFDLSEVSTGGEHLMTIDFQTSGGGPLGFTEQLALQIPGFPSNVWLAQTVWQVALPANQYLFTYPLNLTPQFHWERGLVFWSRVPFAEYTDLSQWMAVPEGAAPADRDELDRGNRYHFGGFGPAGGVSFRCMSQQILLVLGAGFALLLGVIVLQVPATRHVLTFLILAFGATVVGLWYSAPVQLLLQPALIGLMAVGIGVFIQSLNSRTKRPETVLTLSTASSDFAVTSPSSVERRAVVAVGSDEPTSVRPVQAGVSEMQSSFDSRSGS